MTIRHKLLLGLGIISLTMLGLGSLAIVSMNSINILTQSFYDQALMGSTFSQSATARFFKIKEEFQRAYSLDEDARDEMLEAIEADKVRFLEDLEIVQERSLDARIQERVPSVIENIKVWISDQTMRLEASKAASKAEESPATQKMMNRIEKDLSFLTHVATEAGFASRVEAEEQGQTLIVTTIVTTISGLFIAWGVAWMICGPIIRRVSQVEKILQQATQGDMSGRINFIQRDEIGRIGKHLNALFDTASHVVGEVCQTAEQVSAVASEISDGHRDTSLPVPKQDGSVATKVPELTKDLRKVT